MEHVIWTNDIWANPRETEAWIKELSEEYPDWNRGSLIDLIYSLNDDYFNDELVNLDKELDGEIVMYGSLGLWNGRRTGYKIIHKTNLNAILSGNCGDYTTWYVEDGEVCCKDVHHDGTNYYVYRVLDGIDAYDFEEYVADHSLKEAVDKYTKPLGEEVAEIYGFAETKND